MTPEQIMRQKYPDLKQAWLAMMQASVKFDKYMERRSVVDFLFRRKRYKRNLIKIQYWDKTYLRCLENYHFLYKLYL